MFDLRYHVVSLAAVFLALVIGILVGVGLTSQGVLSTTEAKVKDQQISDLQRTLNSTRQQVTDLRRAKRVADDYVKGTYPALMLHRLAKTRVAVLFAGSVDGGVRSEIGETLADASSLGPARLGSLRLPVDVQKVNRVLRERSFSRYVGQPGRLGSALADEFVLGGKMPLWSSLTRQLTSTQDGAEQDSVDAVVVVRSAAPQMRGSARFLSGLYNELVALRVPVVGVEESDSALSCVGTFKKHGLSSVDDLDTTAGRLALAVVLAGGQAGHYGIKPAADDLLPPVEPVRTTARTGA